MLLRRVRAATVALSLLACGSGVRAGGVFFYEVGTPDMFTAGAGWSARAQDAGTVLTNPAGMTRLPGGDLMVGAGALYGDIGFSPGANTSVNGSDGGVAVGWLPNGGGYYTHALSERFWIGVAATSSFGLAASYDEGWVGRYYVEESALLGLSVLPSVAYRVNPQWSVGASLHAMYGILENDVALNSVLPAEDDGRLSLSMRDMGVGGNAGVLWEASEVARVGLTYTSPVELDFADVPEFSNLGPGMQAALQSAGILDAELGLGITVPQTVMASFWLDLNADWSLVGDIGWQDWSRFGGVEVSAADDPPSKLTTQLPYTDTWRVAMGARRQLDRWSVSGGVGYDSPMVEDEDRSVALPVGSTLRFAAGTQTTLSDRMDIGFGYTLVWIGEMPVDQERGPLAGRVHGTYESSAIHVFGLNGHWTF